MQTISEVIVQLEHLVADCRHKQDARGYFAALYLQMTRRVATGIANGVFDDGPRMERLDVLFASRYFDAWDTYPSGTATAPWKLAFDEATQDSIAILQHLLCGINAHINLDLGIAASQTVPHSEIQQLHSDFNRINTVISDLLTEVQVKLGNISWPMRFLDRISGDKDTAVANFSIRVARDAAWKVATDLSSGIDEHMYIQTLEKNVALLGSRIANPGFAANLILKPVKWFEKGTVGEKIDLFLN
jgi:hypothetical protein